MFYLYGITTAIAGIVSGWVLARWQCRRLLNSLTEVYVDPNSTARDDARFRGPTRGALILIILLAASLLVGFGIQQSIFQRQARDRSACMEAWGDRVITTLAARSEAGRDVDQASAAADKAGQARDDAVASVLDIVIGLRAHPPIATTADFDRALATFTTAQSDLDAARRKQESTRKAQEQTRTDNAYPRLDCR